jgi:phosphoribosylformylglycinamidine synthase subunit PurS
VKDYMVEVRVTPRAGLLDPEGNAILGALHTLQFDDVADVRVGRLMRLKVSADGVSAARTLVEDMCRKLLANPVTEDFAIDVQEG